MDETAFVERKVMENPSGRKFLWENTLDSRLDVVFRKKKLPGVFILLKFIFFFPVNWFIYPIISQFDISSLDYLLHSSYMGMCLSNLMVNDSLSLSMCGHSSLTIFLFSSYCSFASGSLVRLLHDELDCYGFLGHVLSEVSCLKSSHGP